MSGNQTGLQRYMTSPKLLLLNNIRIECLYIPQKYLNADPRQHKKNKNGRCLGNILRIPAYRPPNVKQLGYHEAAFPEELVAVMVETFTGESDTVLDPFLGSGTTLKVCGG